MTATLLALRTSWALNAAPAMTGHWRMSKYAEPSPWMRVYQFWLPAATWAELWISGLNCVTKLISRSMASASSIVSVPAPPQPVRAPVRLMLPDQTRTTFWPMLAICASICALAP